MFDAYGNHAKGSKVLLKLGGFSMKDQMVKKHEVMCFSKFRAVLMSEFCKWRFVLLFYVWEMKENGGNENLVESGSEFLRQYGRKIQSFVYLHLIFLPPTLPNKASKMAFVDT